MSNFRTSQHSDIFILNFAIILSGSRSLYTNNKAKSHKHASQTNLWNNIPAGRNKTTPVETGRTETFQVESGLIRSIQVEHSRGPRLRQASKQENSPKHPPQKANRPAPNTVTTKALALLSKRAHPKGLISQARARYYE